MIVPQFWAEGRARTDVNGHQVTVRRFGWSDTGQAEAQAMADERADAALDRVMRGEKAPRREPKVAYNGAEGVPIREEIVSRHGDTVLTRNSYGALCINTPDVLFADIDFKEGVPEVATCLTQILLLAGAAVAGWMTGSKAAGLVLMATALFLGYAFPAIVGWVMRLRGGEVQLARKRIYRFANANPDWRLNIYRTPAGFRVMAMHRTFDPSEPEVERFFSALGTDPVYRRMCQKQRCFRARVSPKPWRVGIQEHMRPRPGVWPVNPERLPERAAWIATYEKAAREYASCQFIESIGSGMTHPAAQTVQDLHDRLSRAMEPLPIA